MSSIVKGVGWVAGSRLLVRVLGSISVLIVARFLTPEDFGVMAIAIAIYGLLESFSQFGFNQSLIHKRDCSADDYNTVWTLNILRSLAVAIIMWIACAVMYIVKADAPVAQVVAVIAFVSLLDGVFNSRFYQYEKELQFSNIFKLNAISKLLAVITTISLAILWGSYWVLVCGMLVNSVTKTLLSFMLVEEYPRLSLKSTAKVFAFSGWMFGAEAVGATYSRGRPIVVKNIFDMHFLGLVHMSEQLVETLNEIAAPVRRVIFPALSAHAPNSKEFVLLYRNAVASLFLVLAPIAICGVYGAPFVVPLVLGEQWKATIEIIQLLLVVYGLTCAGRLAQSAITAAGDTKRYFYRSVVVYPLCIVLTAVLSLLYGENGFYGSVVVSQVYLCGVNFRLAKSYTGLGIWAHLQIMSHYLWPLTFLTGALAVAFHYGAISSLNSVVAAAKFLLVYLFVGIGYLALLYYSWCKRGRPGTIEKNVFAIVEKWSMR